jgi:hypothetical protein
MKKNILIGFICLFIGVFIGYNINKYKSKLEYFELQENYTDKELGTIKKGTILKYDQGFSEGFTRYILFLNIHDSEQPKLKEENIEDVIPYWIEKEKDLSK